MNRQEIKKLKSADLLKKLEALNSQPVFEAADLLVLKYVLDEIEARAEIRLNKSVVTERMKAARGETKPETCLTKIETSETTGINLMVLDKESVSDIPGLKRYQFGYALDMEKAFEGENIIPLTHVLSMIDVRADSVVCAKVKKVTPFMNSRPLCEVKIEGLLSFEATKEKPWSAKEIIRKAYKDGKLELSKDIAVKLVEQKIIKVDISKQFGIALNKEILFKIDQSFGKHGVVYGVVYPVDEVDADGDSANKEEVLKACWKFMEDYQTLNFMHNDDIRPGEVVVVECACALASVPELGIKKGDWYIAVKVKDAEIKRLIESGEITGFSMEGSAIPA